MEQTIQLLDIYEHLHRHYGDGAYWWPIFTPNWRWETVLGAILVQQTQWERVEQAIQRLHTRGFVDEHALAEASIEHIVEAIKPVSYYNAKAPSLQHFARYVVEHYDGAVMHMFQRPTQDIRAELLRLPHIGPETADAILVYAGHRASFVVDGYLRRLFRRIGTIPGCTSMSYDRLQTIIEDALPADVDLEKYPHLQGSRARFYADFHALIVEHGIHHCLPRRPRCDQESAPRRGYTQVVKSVTPRPPCTGCPLRSMCQTYQLPPEERQ